MEDVLARICDAKLKHVGKQQRIISEYTLDSIIKTVSTPRGFHAALRQKVEAQSIGLIAEVKKASPSKGIIREDFHPVDIAKAYVEGGATCISVLTDVPFFQGEDSYLVDVHSAVTLPVLRKDFMLDPYQIKESRALGADCILLIMAALSDIQARELEQVALELGMDVLVEVHDAAECERALRLKTTLLGVNNRNLKTLEVDLNTTKSLAAMVPPSYTLVCESGIYTHEDIIAMQQVGAHCFLVGESLVREWDVAAATKKLINVK